MWESVREMGGYWRGEEGGRMWEGVIDGGKMRKMGGCGVG